MVPRRLYRRARDARSAKLSLGDRGEVLVEYALTMPYLLGFLYGLMEISHYGYLQIMTANAAHDGLRYAIVHSSINADPLGASDIETYVNNELTGFGLTDTGSSVTVTYSTNNAPGSTVNVQVSYPFTPFMPGFNSLPGFTTTYTNLVGPITASAQMMLDR